LNDKKTIFDPIRKVDVLAYPEEIVRQNLILEMVNNLSFPKEYICVEKNLKELPFLKEIKNLPKRRTYIICFFKKKDFLYPLLLIECKKDSISKKAIEQAIGYNHFIKAYFFCLAAKDKIQTFWYNKKEQKYKNVNFLPAYEQLIHAVQNRN